MEIDYELNPHIENGMGRLEFILMCISNLPEQAIAQCKAYENKPLYYTNITVGKKTHYVFGDSEKQFKENYLLVCNHI